MLDLNAVATAIANAVTTAAIQLNGKTVTALDFVPQALDPPTFCVGEFDNQMHRTHGGLNELTLKCVLYISLATEDEGQRKARAAASSTGTPSIQTAIEAARGLPGQMALGGAANDLVLRNATGPKVFEVAGKAYYGVEFELYVVG